MRKIIMLFVVMFIASMAISISPEFAEAKKGGHGTYYTEPVPTQNGSVMQVGRRGVFGVDSNFLVYEPGNNHSQAGVARLEFEYYRSETSWDGCPDRTPNKNAKNVHRSEIKEGGFRDQIVGDHPPAPPVITGSSNRSTGNGFVEAIPSAVAGYFTGGSSIAVNQIGGGAHSNSEINDSGNSKSISKSRSDSKSISKSKSGANVDVGVKVK